LFTKHLDRSSLNLRIVQPWYILNIIPFFLFPTASINSSAFVFAFVIKFSRKSFHLKFWKGCFVLSEWEVWVCVCVRERERERERESVWCVCVCVCERERDSVCVWERESVCVRERECVWVLESVCVFLIPAFYFLSRPPTSNLI